MCLAGSKPHSYTCSEIDHGELTFANSKFITLTKRHPAICRAIKFYSRGAGVFRKRQADLWKREHEFGATRLLEEAAVNKTSRRMKDFQLFVGQVVKNCVGLLALATRNAAPRPRPRQQGLRHMNIFTASGFILQNCFQKNIL